MCKIRNTQSRGTAHARWFSDCGFTLIEFVVALTLLSILSGVVASVFLLFSNWRVVWQEQLELENRAHLVLHGVSTDLRRATNIIVQGDSLWIIQHVGGKKILYAIQDSSLFRDRKEISGEPYRIRRFSLLVDSLPHSVGESRYRSDRRNLVSIQFELLAKKSSIRLGSHVRLRNAALWDNEAGLAGANVEVQVP